MYCKSCAARSVAFTPVTVRRSPCQRRRSRFAPRARHDPGEEAYYRDHGHAVDIKGTVDRVEQEQQAAAAPPLEPARPSTGGRIGKTALFGIAAFFAASFILSAVNYGLKFNSEDAKKKRNTIKNASLVTTLSEILPDNRDRLTTGLLWKLRMQTGFNYTEMFRKFLWFVLKERKFDETAVEDLIVLKDRMNLSNAEVSAALYERCVRIEKKFGNLMLQTDGLSEKAVQRKATCRALFSKLLYLVENEKVLKPNDELNVRVMRNIFGATENDIEDLRIVSLHEVDMDKLDTMARGED